VGIDHNEILTITVGSEVYMNALPWFCGPDPWVYIVVPVVVTMGDPVHMQPGQLRAVFEPWMC